MKLKQLKSELLSGLRKGFFTSIFFVLFLSVYSVFAISWPTSTPSGSVSGGKFMEFFNKILVDTSDLSDGTVKKSLNGVPSGAVMSFSLLNCPSGWSNYNFALNRTIIGAGDTYILGQIGGAETHVLTVNEMPAHKHVGGVSSERNGWGRDSFRYGGEGISGEWIRNAGISGYQGTFAYTSTEGGSQAHNNMQPYIALTYCIKD